MEKFAIKIDENVRLRLYKICRLCGTDNPNNSTIIEEEKICSDGEPEFQKKVLDCIGIQVTQIDKMPQTVCHLCRDKINDFFEFREMCLSNEIQTRRLLGLPAVCAAKIEPSGDIKVQLEDDKTSVEKTIKKRKYTQKKDKVEKKPPPDIKKKLKTEIAIPKKVKGRKRKAQPMNLLAEKPPNKRERLRETQITRKSKHILPSMTMPTIAVDGAVSNVFCSICDNAFYNAGELHRHLDIDHVPRVVSYHCVRCNESIEDKAAIKNHNLWHKLSKTSFECGRCGKEFVSLVGYTKHSQSCLVQFNQCVQYETKTCKTCNNDFVTRNLYNWHSCVLAKLKCPLCQRRFVRKISALKHIVRCSSTPINSTATPLSPEVEIPADEPFENSISDDGLSIDDEINIKPDIEFEIEVPRKEPESEPSHFVVIPPGGTNLALNPTSIADKNTNTFIPGQIGYSIRNLEKGNSDHLNILKHNKKQQLPSISIKKEPGLNIAETDSNVNVSNALNINEVATNANKAPELASTEVRIKAEIINHDYLGLYDSGIIGNIKEELIDSGENVVVPKPTLKLVIKKEHGTLNSSFVSGGSSSCDDLLTLRKKKKKSKKIFKIPKELAMKIKQEKLDSYEAGVNADSDELDEVESTGVTIPIISEVCSRLSNSDCSSAFSFGNKESNLRVPIIASVSSGNTVLPNPANLTIQADKPSLFPAIRIKSEFSLFNFAENENSVSNEILASGSIGPVGNIRIKTEPNFEEDEYQCPVLCSNQENVDIVEGQSQNIVPLEMNIFSPIVAESTNVDLCSSLNANESGSSLRNEEENEAIDFVISRVESINHKTESRVGKIPLECGDKTAKKELGTSSNFDTCETLPKSSENQSNAPDQHQENTTGSNRTCDESCQDISLKNNDNESSDLQEINDDTIESQNPDNPRETPELRAMRVLEMNEEVESANLAEINIDKIGSRNSDVSENCSNATLNLTETCNSKINNYKRRASNFEDESPNGSEIIESQNPKVLQNFLNDTLNLGEKSVSKINNDKIRAHDGLSNETIFNDDLIEPKNPEVQSNYENEALNLSEKFVSKKNEDEIEAEDEDSEDESLNVTQIESSNLIKSNNSIITEDKIRAQDSDVKSLNEANFNDSNHESHNPDVHPSDANKIRSSKIDDVEITAQDSEVDKKIASQNAATLNCTNTKLNLSKDSIPKRWDDKIRAEESDRTDKFVTSVPEEMSAPSYDSDIKNDLEEYENDEKELESDIEDLELTKDISSLRDLDQEIHKNEGIVKQVNKQLIIVDTLNPRDEESLLERKQTIVAKNQYLLEERTSKPLNSAHSNENILELNCDKEENLDINSEMNSIPSAESETLPSAEDLTYKGKIDTTNAAHNFDLENKFEQESNSDENSNESTISSLPCPSELIHENLNQPERRLPDNEKSNPTIEPNTLSQIPQQSSSENSDAILNENNPMPSTSHSIMFNINEIAENNNNANIEKQLQNDFDDISSNSNLDFDETTVTSLSEISENSISLGASDKLSN